MLFCPFFDLVILSSTVRGSVGAGHAHGHSAGARRWIAARVVVVLLCHLWAAVPPRAPWPVRRGRGPAQVGGALCLGRPAPGRIQ